jgi:RND family efflux transporter MFP subunit
MKSVITLTSLAALMLASCGKNEGAAAPMQFPPPGVTVAPPLQQEVQDWDEFTGRIDAVESVEIRPRVSGYIDKVHFKSGQLIKKGDLLFTIDPRPFQAVLDRFEAEVQRAKTKLDLTKKELDRADRLTAAKAISTEEADTKTMAYREANDALRSAEAAVKASALDVEFASVRSPISGRVSREMVTAGNYVSGVAGFTTLLTSVVATEQVYVYADVDEATFLRYQRLSTEGKGTHLTDKPTTAEMQLEGESNYPHKGRIESFDNRIQGSTGSILVRAVFDNKDGTLRPGTFVRMRLPGGPPYQALLVSEEAIGTDQGRKFVLTVGADKMSQYKTVELGPLVGENRVIRTGLAKDDSVIINGLAKVRPGMPVDAKPAEKKVAETSVK